MVAVAAFVYLFTFVTKNTVVRNAVLLNSKCLKSTDIDLSFGTKIT